VFDFYWVGFVGLVELVYELFEVCVDGDFGDVEGVAEYDVCGFVFYFG